MADPPQAVGDDLRRVPAAGFTSPATAATPGRRSSPATTAMPDGPWGKIGVAVVAVEFATYLRPDRSGRRGPVPVRRRRQKSETDEATIKPPPAGRGYYSTIDCRPGERRRRLVPAGADAQGASTGASRSRWVKGIQPRRQPRRLDRSQEPEGGSSTCNDGGAGHQHRRRQESGFAPPLPISQFYHVNCDQLGPVPRHGQHAGPRHGEAGRATACPRPASGSATGTPVGGGETGSPCLTQRTRNVVYARRVRRLPVAVRPPHPH